MKLILKIAPLLISLAGVAVYAGSFSGAFIFDDFIWIVDNPDIKSFWSSLLGSSRPLIGFTLYLNYIAGGLKAADYHAVNLTIHVVAGLLLYAILGRTFRLMHRDVTKEDKFSLLAFFMALLWVVHPLQTESVTYVIQRSESLMGLFYLLMLYCFMRGASGGRAADGCFTGAIVACALGMACKPVMMTAPLMLLLYDRTFLAGSFSQALKQRTGLYIGAFATLIIPVALLSVPNESSSSAGFGAATVSPLNYLVTQAGVVLHYIRLAFWPAGLCLDYDWQPAEISLVTALQIFGVLFLCGLFFWLFIRRNPAGFVGLAFFLLLFPTSSFIPLSDCAAEHRMYLPLACVIVLAVMGVAWVLDKCGDMLPSQNLSSLYVFALAGILVAGMSLVTIERNRAYQSELKIWQQVVAVRPLNLRGHLGVGYCHLKTGHLREAESSFLKVLADARFPDRKASRYATEFATAYGNLGAIRFQEGRFGEAEQCFRESLLIARTPSVEGNMQLVQSMKHKKICP